MAGTILALGVVAATCIAAGAGTFAVARETHRRSNGRMSDFLETVLVVVVAIVTFGGGWLLVMLYWLGLYGSRFARRGLAWR